MKWLVVADDECMELLDAAAEMAAAALAARSRRIDQDGVLQRSVDMSRIKIETLRQSMHTAPLGNFSDLEPADSAAVFRLMTMMKAAETPGEHDAIWKTLRAYMLRPGKEKPFAGGERPWADGDLSKPRVASTAKGSSPAEAEMPVPVRKRRPRNTSQKTAR